MILPDFQIGDASKAVPETMASFQAFDKAALADGAIPKKYKELMAVAVGLTTKCPYCIDVHRKAALNAGATEQELPRDPTAAQAWALNRPVDDTP